MLFTRWCTRVTRECTEARATVSPATVSQLNGSQFAGPQRRTLFAVRCISSTNVMFLLRPPSLELSKFQFERSSWTKDLQSRVN